MLSRLLPNRPARLASRTPAGCVIWAVGDIHGRSDLADRLIQAIRADLHGSEATRKVVVFLGDMIDRGLDSRGVLNQLSNLAADPGLEVHFIRGNHEDRLEAFLHDPEAGPGWCDCGGRDTLLSYGLRPPRDSNPAAWAEASQALGEALPESHRELLASQENAVSIGDYFFVHAGARPGVALRAQSPHDLMWIRGPFLDHAAPFEQVIVHGHTPADTVHSDARRIGLDTGAYATNILSAVRLEGEARMVMQATGRAGRVGITTSPLTA
jgi:serine/threonine protein phosphatase 1